MKKLAMLFCVAVSVLWAETPDLLLKKSAAFYKSFKTAKIEFSQTVFYEVTGDETKTEGELLLGGGDLFVLKIPQVQIFSDGINLWEYRVMQKQVIVKDLLDLDNAYHPSQILFKYLDCKATKATKIKEEGKTYWHLVLDPNRKIKGIEELEVWLDTKNFSPKKIKTIDVTGNRSFYSIKKMATKLSLEKKEFRFVETPQVEVLDLR